MQANDLIKCEENIHFAFQILNSKKEQSISASDLTFRSNLHGLLIELNEVENTMIGKTIDLSMFKQMLSKVSQDQMVK